MQAGGTCILNDTEREALVADRSRHWWRVCRTVLVALLLFAILPAVYLPVAGHLDHVLGRSVPTTAVCR